PPGAAHHLRLRWAAFAACGVILLVLAGQRYRIDQVRCWSWPSFATGVSATSLFLLGLGVLSAAWIGLDRDLRRAADPRPGAVFLIGAALHAGALLVLPYLSDDPLAYAAIGRAMTAYHEQAATPLGISLPVGDPVRALISQY